MYYCSAAPLFLLAEDRIHLVSTLTGWPTFGNYDECFSFNLPKLHKSRYVLSIMVLRNSSPPTTISHHSWLSLLLCLSLFVSFFLSSIDSLSSSSHMPLTPSVSLMSRKVKIFLWLLFTCYLHLMCTHPHAKMSFCSLIHKLTLLYVFAMKRIC